MWCVHIYGNVQFIRLSEGEVADFCILLHFESSTKYKYMKLYKYRNVNKKLITICHNVLILLHSDIKNPAVVTNCAQYNIKEWMLQRTT